MEGIGVIILAGGKSSRMGEDKGLMTLFGKPMITYVIDAVKEVSTNITIITNNKKYAIFGYPLVKDVIPEKGPLGGIYSGLKASPYEYNIVLSCDIPYIKPALLKYLLLQSEEFDITIAKHLDRFHPLIGIYSKNCLPVISSNLVKGKLKLTALFDELDTNVIETDEFDEIGFRNLNTKQDIHPL
jgi:molybdopterin-guanine dinucleotide biosynthesis protein A